MGVTGLWPILCPVKRHKSLSSLQGQTLAVDLSIWVCENQGVRQMQNRVLKPHLRNLFFRISTLLQMGVRLLFVIEGEAPALKHEEMSRRLQARNKGTSSANTKRKFGRGRLQGYLKECCELLDTLGVPYVQSQGEAEATCAALNAAGVVDACVSDDGDCFLYGATVVYRNLTIDAKDPHVESYSMEDVTSELSLTQERLVALALLLGCDYFPAGVPGVGETWAVKLMASLDHMDVLKRFQQWKSMTASDCLDRTESFVWRKASTLHGFPPQKVIEEFLMPKDPVWSAPTCWSRPCILKMMRLGSHHLGWPEDYSLEKTLPLTTLWDQLHCYSGGSLSPDGSYGCLVPARIVKKRVRQGVPCLEVQWENNMKGLVDEKGQLRLLVTVEQEQRFQACFPALVDAFTHTALVHKADKAKRGKKGRVKKDTTDTLTTQLESLTLSTQPDPTDHCPTDHTAQTGPACSSQTEAPDHHYVPTLDPEMPSSQTQAVLSTSFQTQAFNSLSTDFCHKFGCGSSLPTSFGSVAQSNTRGREAYGVSRKIYATGSPVCETEGTEKQKTADSEGCDVPSPSMINRSVEYVPLSQRLTVLRGGETTCCTEHGDSVVDLDDSYTYIPLSQRLRARLGTQQKTTTLSSARSDASLRALSGSRESWTTSVGSGENWTSSVETCKSQMTRYQNNTPSVLNGSLTYVPLSQRVKNSLDTADKVFTPSSLSEGSETRKTESPSRTQNSGVDVKSSQRCEVFAPPSLSEGAETQKMESPVLNNSGVDVELRKQSAVDSNLSGIEEVGSETCVVDGGTETESGTGKAVDNNSLSSQSTSSSCEAGHSERATACLAQESLSSAGSAVREITPHTNNLPDSGDSLNASSYLTSHNTPCINLPNSGNNLGGSSTSYSDKHNKPCPEEAQIKKSSNSAGSESERCGKKKMRTGHQGRRKGAPCSQRTKQVIRMNDFLQDWSDSEAVDDKRACSVSKEVNCMNDLLQDWSVCEDAGDENSANIDSEEKAGVGNGNNASVIVLSSDDSDQEVDTPIDQSHSEGHAGTKIQPGTTRDVDRYPVKSLWHENSPPPSSVFPTPSNHSSRSRLACPESSTPYEGSVLEARPSDSVERHTTGSPRDGDSFVSDGHFTLHHTLFTSMEDSVDTTKQSPGVGEWSSDTIGAGAAMQHSNHPSAHTDQQAPSDGRRVESPSWHQTPELERNVDDIAGESFHQEDGSFPVMDLSCVDDDESVSCPVTQHNCRSEDKGLQAAIVTRHNSQSEQNGSPAAAPLSSLHQSSGVAHDPKPKEGMDEECFLPLSQRLRLKKSSAKALSSLSSMP
ncbi:hypothetical protein ACOMHN_017006 [Nucella lapillus]